MDVSIFHALNGLAGHALWLDRLLKWLATYLQVVLVGSVVLAWVWPGSAADRVERERLVLYAVGATLLALGIAQVIGHLWFRERPYVHHSAHLLLHPSADPSFPSDHAIGGFALALPFVLARRRLGWWLLSVATVLAVSRVAVGTHYPSDVIGGALLGAGAAWVVWTWRGWIEPVVEPCLRLGHRLHLA